MTFHISDCRKYSRCARMFVLSAAEEKQPYTPYVRTDEVIGDLAAERIGVSDPFTGQLGDDPNLALNALEDHDWLVRARFEYDGLRIKVPFLHRTEDGWEIFFLFAGIYPHANDMEYYCDTVWVLERLGVKICGMHMIHLNADYVRSDELDIEQLFVISDYLYNMKNNPTVPFMEAVADSMYNVSPQLRKMEALDAEQLPPPVRTPKCAGRQKCSFYERCFPEEADLPDNSILTLIGARNRYEMNSEGRCYLRDADEERIEGSPQQYAQIMADRQGGLFADKIALQSWLSDAAYPVSFIDFEWERYAIPPYPGMRPFQVLPFEYSLHILQEDGSVEHKVFLSVHDGRREFTEAMIRDIPENGSIIAYNADGAEKIRISELAEQFPEYADQLNDFNRRMKDLQNPFIAGMIYDVGMRGSWTLKQIMSLMDEPGYNDLEIRQGMDAVFRWRMLDRDEDVNREEIIEDLKKYCGMDTWAMVVVFRWMKKHAEL